MRRPAILARELGFRTARTEPHAVAFRGLTSSPFVSDSSHGCVSRFSFHALVSTTAPRLKCSLFGDLAARVLQDFRILLWFPSVIESIEYPDARSEGVHALAPC